MEWGEVKIDLQRPGAEAYPLNPEAKSQTENRVRTELERHFHDGPEKAAESRQEFWKWSIENATAIKEHRPSPEINRPAQRWIRFLVDHQKGEKEQRDKGVEPCKVEYMKFPRDQKQKGRRL